MFSVITVDVQEGSQNKLSYISSCGNTLSVLISTDALLRITFFAL